ncbi:MAG: hypothetical protein VX529_08690 [Pseudomonadota bacterium]|nr:hypothetical protein [Pseudomonadota bacterium]
MYDFQTAQRLVRIQERLRNATYHEMRKDGPHKMSEGAMELCFHMPAVVGDREEPCWSVWAYSYLLCPDGRSERWFGKTPEEAISKAEDAIEKWCFGAEMEQFGEFMGEPIDDDEEDHTNG